MTKHTLHRKTVQNVIIKYVQDSRIIGYIRARDSNYDNDSV